MPALASPTAGTPPGDRKAEESPLQFRTHVRDCQTPSACRSRLLLRRYAMSVAPPKLPELRRTHPEIGASAAVIHIERTDRSNRRQRPRHGDGGVRRCDCRGQVRGWTSVEDSL